MAQGQPGGASRVRRRRSAVAMMAFSVLAVLARITPAFAATPILPAVAPGYGVGVFAPGVPSAREFAAGPPGLMFVGSKTAGNVYALSYDPLSPTKATRVRVIARGFEMPTGIAYRNGDLYIADIRRILVVRDVLHHLDAPAKPEVIVNDLPWKEGDHDWKFIAFGPDGKLYVPIGSPCNACYTGPDFATILRMNADGSQRERIASGVRNTVGFDWQPGTGTFWFTENGRDNLGDDLPSDELNRLDKVGAHFGFPYCHQGDLADPELGQGHPCERYTPPAVRLGAHLAPLGMRFYTGTAMPELRGGVVIAEHGSWNRTGYAGYRVIGLPRVPTTGTATAKGEIVLMNFLTPDGQVTGRPADVQPLSDGSILVSDDRQGAIFRLVGKEKAS